MEGANIVEGEVTGGEGRNIVCREAVRRCVLGKFRRREADRY